MEEEGDDSDWETKSDATSNTDETTDSDRGTESDPAESRWALETVDGDEQRRQDLVQRVQRRYEKIGREEVDG